MKYLPQQITTLLSTTAIATYAQWAVDATYNIENESAGLTNISVAREGYYLYRTIADGNVGNKPSENLGTYWTNWGVANPFAMLDLRSSTSTVSVGTPLVVEVANNNIDTVAVGNFIAAKVIIDNLDDTEGIISGFAIEPSGTGVNYLNITAGIAYIGATTTVRTAAEGEDHAFTASKDTYIDIGLNGLLFTEVVNGAATPTIAPDTLRIAKVVTDAGGNTIATDLRNIVDNVLHTQELVQSVSESVDDYYSYIYSEYSSGTLRGRIFQVPIAGAKIRITFESSEVTPNVSCGFLVAGRAEDMGDTLFGAAFSFESYTVKETDSFGVTTLTKRSTQDLVDFETVIPSHLIASKKQEIKNLYGEPVVFMLDPDTESKYDNLLTLGVIENVSTVLENAVQTTISWSIQEII